MRTGTGKQQCRLRCFPTVEDAEAALVNIAIKRDLQGQQHRQERSAFPCPHGDHYHLSRQPPRPQAN